MLKREINRKVIMSNFITFYKFNKSEKMIKNIEDLKREDLILNED